MQHLSCVYSYVVCSTNEENKTRRAVRTNNFTQQTNALDVDKHMMAYIEENMKLRRGPDAQLDADKNTSSSSSKRQDPEEDLYQLPEKYKTQAPRPQEEGSLTNSLSMLTAIPEVDLGMECVHVYLIRPWMTELIVLFTMKITTVFG